MNSLTLAFIPFAAILTITPGSDTMLVVNNSLTRSTKDGLFTVLGINAGLLFHALASALGLSVIISQSEYAYNIVKFAGAFYIIYLGLISLKNGFSSSSETKSHSLKSKSSFSSLREGFLTNILNPKVAIFYLALLPQFIAPSENILNKSLLLMSIHFIMGITWLTFVSLTLGKFKNFASNTKLKKRLEKFSGFVFILFGTKLLLSHR